MKIFIATSFSSKVDYSTGKVDSEFRPWLETRVLNPIKKLKLDYFCAIEEEGWVINNSNSAQAMIDDFAQLRGCDTLLVVLDEDVSPGLQIEIGIAHERKMPIILAHEKNIKLKWSNQALVDAGAAKKMTIPFTITRLQEALNWQN